MRIGFDAKRAFWNNTGLGNYSRFVINGLTEHYPNNEYFLYSTGISPHSELSISNKHITTVDLGKTIIGKLKRTIRYGENKLDILHGLSNELPFSAKRSGCKLIVSIHDLLFLRYPEFYPFLDRQIYLAKTQRACKQADLIIAISEQTKQDLIDFLNIPSSKIVVHYQSCHPQFWHQYQSEEIEKAKQKYGISESYILQVGTLENRKNALLTLKAFTKSKSRNLYQLVLLGKKTPYCDQLYEFVQSHHLSEHVKFIFQSDFSDFPLLYHGASLSVYPSLFEGFGIPILEAMCCNVPVITSKDGCFSEVGGDAALYINPKDENDLQEKIDQVLSDESFRQGLIEKGKIQAGKFSSNILIDELMNIYQSLHN